MLVLSLLCVGVLSYILVGYPLVLRVIVAMRGARPVRRAAVTPRLSFVISAFNEAAVIREKLENALSLDYPPELRQVVVISDCSNDGTDEIVQEFTSRGVTLARMTERRGKTAGLNKTVPTLTGDIVVFSDANAMYEPDAWKKLVRNFADSEVGYVTGEARYLKNGQAPADVGERAYWGYEMQMKRLETQLGSMVGGDGAIYAIRRSLWQTLPEDAINDFLNPLQIVVAGWRGVYEPEAVCWEETGGGIKSEYKRRVRIVSRSWRAVFQARHALNPFKVGLFAWSLWSHKVLRWMSGIFVLGASVGLAALLANALIAWPVTTVAIALGLTSLLTFAKRGRQITGMLGYFAVINAASLVGICKGSVGRVSGVWSPPRQVEEAGGANGLALPIGPLFLLGCAMTLVALATLVGSDVQRTASLVFWVSALTVVYVYLGYPTLLAILRTVAHRPVRAADHEPRVCLFIAANDEERVIGSKIQNALSLDSPADKLEIVVASDGSVDRTNEIVRGFAPRVRLLEQFPREGKIMAINRGVLLVDAEIVVFSDANTFLAPGSVRTLVRSFADPGVGCVSGDVVLFGDRAKLGRPEDLYYRYERWVQRAESEIGSMIGADGALYAIRRRLFKASKADTILDDMAIPMSIVRQGYRAVFEPGAVGHERGVESAREEFSRKARVVAGALQFLTRVESSVPVRAPQVMFSLISHKALRWLSPAFASATFLSSIVLATASREFATIAAAQAMLFGLGLAGCSQSLRRFPPIAIAHYFCLVQAAAALGFLRGLTGRQSVLWRRFIRSAEPSAGPPPADDEQTARTAVMSDHLREDLRG